MRKNKKTTGLLDEKRWRKWLINHLRRISYRWPERNEAKKKARIRRGFYRCAKCKGEFHYKHIQLDHRKSVLDPSSGFTDWNNYIARLFVDREGFQVLCKPCHQKKTNKENAKRVRK